MNQHVGSAASAHEERHRMKYLILKGVFNKVKCVQLSACLKDLDSAVSQCDLYKRL